VISHAQGAIAVARVQTRYGRDDAAKDLGRQLIAIKLDEITRLRRQLGQAKV